MATEFYSPKMTVVEMDDYEAKKISEYNRYRPENAAADMAEDIKAGSLKLFFLDIEEFPEMIAIDAPQERLPAAEHISIGIGCIDPVNGEDCDPAYRSAMENALSYGIRYNRKVAEAFNLRQKVEPDYLPSETLDFLGFPDDWEAFQLELQDVQPLFGGRDILLTAQGHVFVRTVKPGARGLVEKIYRLATDPEARTRILKACIFNDIIGLRMPDQAAPPDHGRPTLILTNADGRHHAIAGWDPPLPGPDPSAAKRFNSVYREILRLESVAEQTSPAMEIENPENTAWEKIRCRHGVSVENQAL